MNITWFGLIVGVLVLFAALPYAQIEVLTRVREGSLSEYTVFCDSPPEYIKVSEYNKLKGDLEIMCVYPDSDKNEIVTLNYRKETWEVIKRKKMYAGNPTWPWYL